MLGSLYNQMMRSRLGLGNRFEGYGGFNPSQQPMNMLQGPTLPQENPFSPQGEGGQHPVDPIGRRGLGGAPANPWLYAEASAQHPVDPIGRRGLGEAPADEYGGGLPTPQPMGGLRGAGRNPYGLGSIAPHNPWQRF